MQKSFRRTQFRCGLRAGIPIVLGYVPVGIAYAILARQAGFTVRETCAMSLFVYAGASEMMAAGMYAQGAGIAAIILATFVLNLRQAIMSTCVFHLTPGASAPLRVLGSFGVTDETFAVFTAEQPKHHNLPFFLGLALIAYLSWNLGTLAGALASDLLPDILTASLGIALYAMFLGLLVPGASRSWQLTALCVLTGLCNTLLSRFLPSGWALIASTLVCAFAGSFFADPDGGKEEAHV